jgi:hypothetical protein
MRSKRLSGGRPRARGGGERAVEDWTLAVGLAVLIALLVGPLVHPWWPGDLWEAWRKRRGPSSTRSGG